MHPDHLRSVLWSQTENHVQSNQNCMLGARAVVLIHIMNVSMKQIVSF